MRRILAAVVAGTMLSVAACSTHPSDLTVARHESAPPQSANLKQLMAAGMPSQPLRLRVPIRGIMAGVIDFSAHGVFETSTSEMPLTENDWLAAGLASINLIGSTTLITTAGTGPDDAEWVSDPEWRQWAQTMQSASISAGTAIARRDRVAYLNAANHLADACQSCHKRFRPEAPLSNSQFAENVRRGLDLDR